MRLDALIELIRPVRITGPTEREVVSVTADSRQVEPGSLFVAVAGEHDDGHRFVAEAASRGAAAAVVGRPVATEGPMAVITVSNTRRALALLAAGFYGFPSRRLRLTGVTGTNGKTTTTYLIRQILRGAGRKVGLIGTVGYDLGDEQMAAPHTTPEAPILQKLLSRMADGGLQDAVMEVSSHALDQDRVAGCRFEVGVFTNLTQDHLDFHGTMERYFSAKGKLFDGPGDVEPGLKRAVINRDDPWGRKLIGRLEGPVWTYGLAGGADIRAEGVTSDLDGLRFTLRTPNGDIDVESPLLGDYNVFNILAAAGVGLHYEVPLPVIRDGIRAMRAVPGRLELVRGGQAFRVVVDYAHTESALVRLLEAIGPLTTGRIITVFGCGGDRDRGKRAPMGVAAVRLSDRVILTSDNPRTEDPMGIIREVEAGIRAGMESGARASGYEILADRREAIEKAVGMARAEDVVVLAGKGHEDYQVIGKQRKPFDDRLVAAEAIKKRLGA